MTPLNGLRRAVRLNASDANLASLPRQGRLMEEQLSDLVAWRAGEKQPSLTAYSALLHVFRTPVGGLRP